MSFEFDVVLEKLDRIAAEVRHLDSVVQQVVQELAHLKEIVEPPTQRALPFLPADPFEQLVSLDQAAAIVRRGKSCLESYRHKGMPKPKIRGRRGQPSLWVWAEMRVWLETTFGIPMPQDYPGMAG